MLQGANLGVTKLVTGSVSSPNINQMDGYDSLNWIFAHEFQIGSVTLSITVIWWFLFVALSAVRAAAHQDRQLDLRGRRELRVGPRGRCPGHPRSRSACS